MQAALSSPYRPAVAGMIGMGAAMGFGRFVYTPILPRMMEELGLATSDAGLVAAANFLGYLIGAVLAAGAWAVGLEGLLLAGSLALNALLLVAMGSTESIGAFLAIRFVSGAANAFVMVFLSAKVMGQLARAGRGDLQAVHFAGVGLGIAGSSLLVLGVALAGAPWYWSWIGCGIVAGFAAAVVPMLLGDAGTVQPGRPKPEPPLPPGRDLRLVILAYGLFGFGYIVTATFLIAIVRDGGAGTFFEPAVWLVTGLACAPSTWMWQLVARRTGRGRAFALCCLLQAVGVAASVLVPGPTGPLIAAILLGGTFVAGTALGLQMGSEMAPSAPRRTIALMTAAFGVGQIAGPAVTGYLADLAGYGFPSALAALILLIAGGVLLLVRSPAAP